MRFVQGFLAGMLSVMAVFGVVELLPWGTVAVVAVIGVAVYWKRKVILSRLASWAVKRTFSKLGAGPQGGENDD